MPSVTYFHPKYLNLFWKNIPRKCCFTLTQCQSVSTCESEVSSFKNTHGKSNPIFQLRSIMDNLAFFSNDNAPSKYKYHTLFGSNSATNSSSFVTHHSFKLFQKSLFIDITLENNSQLEMQMIIYSLSVIFIMYV